MNSYLSLIVCHVLIERIALNNKTLEVTTDPIVIQILEDENKACKYAIEQLEGGKMYETD